MRSVEIVEDLPRLGTGMLNRDVSMGGHRVEEGRGLDWLQRSGQNSPIGRQSKESDGHRGQHDNRFGVRHHLDEFTSGSSMMFSPRIDSVEQDVHVN
jgi:hypothetical protein